MSGTVSLHEPRRLCNDPERTSMILHLHKAVGVIVISKSEMQFEEEVFYLSWQNKTFTSFTTFTKTSCERAEKLTLMLSFGFHSLKQMPPLQTWIIVRYQNNMSC